MRRRLSSNLQPALGTIQEYEEPQHPAISIESPKTPTVTFGEAYMQEYPPSSPAESPKSQQSPTSSSESPTSPLSPRAKEIEESLKEAQENTKKNAEESIKELTTTLGGAVVLQDPSASRLLQRRSQST